MWSGAHVHDAKTGIGARMRAVAACVRIPALRIKVASRDVADAASHAILEVSPTPSSLTRACAYV